MRINILLYSEFECFSFATFLPSYPAIQNIFCLHFIKNYTKRHADWRVFWYLVGLQGLEPGTVRL